ncbi:MAG TPA: DUF4114 domain-containing protein [Phycisphaerales bacterium]|nr:DUF4114 domain-containing protein [Phycisphaerales bacterium]
MAMVIFVAEKLNREQNEFTIVICIARGGIMRQVCLFTICSVLALSLPAMATIMIDKPDLGDVLGDGQFDGIGPSDQYYLSLSDASGIQTVEFSLLGEEAGFAKWNRMGIYDHADPSKTLEIFRGEDTVGDSFVVTFDLDKGQAWIGDKGKKHKHKGKGKTISIGSEFGFYLDSGDSGNNGGLFYSESSLNTDADLGVPHALIFDIEEVENVVGNLDIAIAFEDLKINARNGSFDGDYNDMVVGMSSTANIIIVPEPATMALLGFGYLIFLRKKK